MNLNYYNKLLARHEMKQINKLRELLIKTTFTFHTKINSFLCCLHVVFLVLQHFMFEITLSKAKVNCKHGLNMLSKREIPEM